MSVPTQNWLETISDHQLTFLSLVVALISVPVTLIATAIAYRAAKHDRRVAAAEGTFNLPTLIGSLASEQCCSRILLGIDLCEERVQEINLPLIIRNKGKKTAEDVTAYLKIPKTLAYDNQVDCMKGVGAGGNIREIKVDFVATDEITTIILQIPKVQTFDVIDATIPLSLYSETKGKSSTVITNSDGSQVELPYTIYYSYIMLLTISCPNAQPISRAYKYSLEIIDTTGSNLTKIINERNDALVAAHPPPYLDKRGIHRFYHRIKYWIGYRGKFSEITVISVTNTCKIEDAKSPIDRYPVGTMVFFGGCRDGRDGTIWVPGLKTNAFGLKRNR